MWAICGLQSKDFCISWHWKLILLAHELQNKLSCYPRLPNYSVKIKTWNFPLHSMGFLVKWEELMKVWWITLETGALKHSRVQIASFLLKWEFAFCSLRNAERLHCKHSLFHLVEFPFTTYLICGTIHNFIITSKFSIPNAKLLEYLFLGNKMQKAA